MTGFIFVMMRSRGEDLRKALYGRRSGLWGRRAFTTLRISGGKCEGSMPTSSKADRELLDNFVRYLNDAGFEPGFPDDIPRELRTSESDYGMFNWRIQPATSNPWIEDL